MSDSSAVAWLHRTMLVLRGELEEREETIRRLRRRGRRGRRRRTGLGGERETRGGSGGGRETQGGLCLVTLEDGEDQDHQEKFLQLQDILCPWSEVSIGGHTVRS